MASGFCKRVLILVFTFEELSKPTLSLKVGPFTSWFHLSNTTFYHIEPDLKEEGNFIIATRNQIFTYNGESLSLIAGSDISGYSDGYNSNSQFDTITEFVQVDSQLIIIADTNNHCIRSVNRYEFDSSLTSTLCGTCLTPGDQLGSVKFTLLRNPRSVSLKKSLYIADTGNERVLKSDISQMTTKAVVQILDIHSPYSLKFKSSDILMILSQEGLYKFNIEDKSTSLISRTGLSKDDWLTNCTTYACIGTPSSGLTLMYETDILLFSEVISPSSIMSKIRYVNLKTNWIGSICYEKPGNGSGVETECEISSTCVLSYDDMIYVGGREHIWKASVLEDEVEETFPTINQREANTVLIELTTVTPLSSSRKNSAANVAGKAGADLDQKSSTTLLVILIVLIGLTGIMIIVLLIIWLKRRQPPELQEKSASTQHLQVKQNEEVTPDQSSHNEP